MNSPWKYSRLLLSFFVAGFLVFLMFSLFTGLKNKQFKGNDAEVAQETEVSIKELSFTQTDTGRLSWSLVAAQAALTEKGRKGLLENISVTIPYGRDAMLSLEGDEGFVDTEKKAFSLWKKRGLMTVDFENGYTLRTAGLKWNESKREIISDGKAFISGEKISIDGNALRVSIDNQEMTVIGDVKALVH
ncbi:MAG: LPS export ABC transporter periplasmic protein LptC [Nitrospiria bacterium]